MTAKPRVGAVTVEPSGLRSETVRSANLSTVLRALHLDGPMSRSDMVARTGLTRSAIGALIGELARAGLVVERPAVSDGSPGRPSPVAVVRSEHNVALAVDVLVDSIGVAAVGLGGVVLDSVRVDRPRSRVSVERTVDDIVDAVAKVEGGRVPSSRIVGMGVGVAGIVRRSDGTVMFAPNLGWRDVPFGHLLHEALGARFDLLVANEADLAVLAEVRRGAARGVDDVVCIWGEVGVGGGFVARGEPITGASGFAGEVGHMPINPDGLHCQCGSIGCWETEVGEGSLLRRTGRRADGGRAEVEAVLAEAAAGAPAVLEALAVEARWLGIGLSGLINAFNPSTVVLGGLFGRLHPHIHAALDAEIGRRATASARAGLQVVPSQLGADTVLLGAAELAFEALLADPLGSTVDNAR
ncbi:MAG: ROK family transcriptional regulator [Actinobacteria bacterium]|nr:ROK family transcriptional regulator [Actinomycetota bacterium]